MDEREVALYSNNVFSDALDGVLYTSRVWITTE